MLLSPSLKVFGITVLEPLQAAWQQIALREFKLWSEYCTPQNPMADW